MGEGTAAQLVLRREMGGSSGAGGSKTAIYVSRLARDAGASACLACPNDRRKQRGLMTHENVSTNPNRACLTCEFQKWAPIPFAKGPH